MAKENEIVTVPKNEIVVYQPNATTRLEVELHDESAWLTQQRIADLFGVQKAAISKHLKNIFATGELIEEEVVSKMETTTQHGAIARRAYPDAVVPRARPLHRLRQHGLDLRVIDQRRQPPHVRPRQDRP